MRVCARLSAVQQAKQQKAATAAVEGPQNDEQKRPQTARKRGRPNSSLTDGGASFWQAAVATRPRRNARPMAVEWQQQQQQGVVQASNFDWEQYLAVRGGTAAQNGHLFQQQHFMERTLAQQIFRPGSSVRVRYPQNGENDLWVSARIGVTFPFGQAVVEFPTRTAPAEQTVRNGRIIGMDSGGVRTEIVQLDVVELPESAEDDKGAATEGTVNDDFRTILREHREWLGRPLHSFVQEGQLFELQEAPSLSRSDSPPQNVPFASSSAISSSQLTAPSAAGSSHNNCLRVHVVRVVAHHNGLVLVERIGRAEDGERRRRELVHITAERCHPLGWARAQHPSDKYSLAEVDLGERTSAVPRWLFSFRPLATHKFEVGMLLEMLDPLNRLSFVPAYVSERVNSHYFKVRPIRDVQNLTALLRTSDHIVHCTSPDIFPVGWCFKNQIRLTFPRGLNHSDNSFSYAALRLELRNLFMQPSSYTNNNNNGGDLASVFSALHPSDGVQAVQHEQLHQQPSCSQPAVLPSSYNSALISVPFSVPMEFSFAPDSLFELPKMAQKRLEFVRYCEVQDAADPTLFYPGAIVRSQQHLVWVHFDRDENTHQPAQIYSISSPQLFRCGTAKSASGAAPFAAAAAFLRYFTVPIRIPTALSANCGRNLLRTFTSQRTPVFLPRQKPFLSEMWLKADLWLPPIYLSANCFCGPFLIADKVRALPAFYASSPLPHAISTLVKDLLACAAGLGTRGVRELINLLVGADRNSKVPLQMLLKFKYTNRRVRFSVEACERAAQFPGWLRTLLIRLDACPNLLSLEKRDKCPLDCSASLASSLYLCHGGHVHTASAQSSQQQTNKLNQAAQQLKKVVQQQLQLQKRRKNGRNKKAKKSEEGDEYAVRQPPQPFPARREPSKRLSIAQPVLDDDYGDDGEEKGTEKAAEDEDGIRTEKGGQAVEGSRRRRSINGNGRAEDGTVGAATAVPNNDEDDSNSRGTLSTTASNTSGSSQQQTDDILEAKAKQMRQQQQQGDRSSSSSSSSALSDSSVDDDGGDGGPSSPVPSSSSSTTTVPVATASTSLSSAIAAPPKTPPLPPQQRRKAKQTATKRMRGVREGHQQHPMAHQQREIKREQLGNSEEDEVQWYDHQQASIIRNATQQQLANVGPAVQTADMDIVHVVTSQQRPTQHYATPPMPLYTPYLYAAMAPPHHQYNPYAYYYAPVATPSAASSSSSAVPPFLHHPHPPHVHLMPAPPPPPPMFAPLSANAAAGTSAANNTASTSNYNNATCTSNFGFDCPPVDSNPSRWSAETLCRWLTAAGLADCAQRLLNEEVDGACLLLFTPINYQNLGLKLGPMVKLQQIAEYLRQFTFADNR
ncbi:hypothetical protein niasHT_020637 [Heterodera trifolii]|uniref:SAM domain-containing protein n=1 Tax=Heterodera trifolii TaxID=157864 RepID=A0ABD2JZR6_9BILA